MKSDIDIIHAAVMQTARDLGLTKEGLPFSILGSNILIQQEVAAIDGEVEAAQAGRLHPQTNER